jgi:hypothetical protein
VAKPTTYQLLPFLWAAGGSLIANAQVTLDSLAVRRALAFLQNLVQVERPMPPVPPPRFMPPGT